jgi:hypothetical protein
VIEADLPTEAAWEGSAGLASLAPGLVEIDMSSDHQDDRRAGQH